MSMAVLIAAAAALGGPAQWSDYSPHDTRVAIEEYGRCIIDKRHDAASQAIVRNFDNDTLRREYPRLIDGTCMPTPPTGNVRVRFAGDQFRYALAEGLVRKDLLALPAPLLGAVAPLDHREPTEPARVDKKGKPLSARRYADAMKNYEEAQAFAYISRYGECVVRTNVAGARNLLATKADSAEESAAFVGLQAALGNCLDEGHQLQFGKLMLRGTIAVNYYRLAAAARGVPVAGAAQ